MTFPLSCTVQVAYGGLQDGSRQGEAWAPCGIRINEALRNVTRERLCALVVHEQGHLFRRDDLRPESQWHSSDPADIMHASAPAGPSCNWITKAENRREDVIDGIVDTREAERSKRRTKRLKRLRRELKRLNRRLHM